MVGDSGAMLHLYFQTRPGGAYGGPQLFLLLLVIHLGLLYGDVCCFRVAAPSTLLVGSTLVHYEEVEGLPKFVFVITCWHYMYRWCTGIGGRRKLYSAFARRCRL